MSLQPLQFTGDLITDTTNAENLAQAGEQAQLPPEWFITVYDNMWNPLGETPDFIECSGADPRNNLPSATLKLKGDDPQIPTMMNCANTMVGVTIETEGLRFAFYVDTHEYAFDKGKWEGTANLLGIWDVLNYLQIWPDWFLPIQAQLLSHAIYFGPICTCVEAMVAEQALRIQSGLNEFINNAGSLNPSIEAWFGTLLIDAGAGYSIYEILKSPIYVVRHNPFLDTSPLICRTVRMESCGAVIKDVTRAYGVDVRVDLWLPGDPQPDEWTATIPELALDRPTYVVSVRDRSQVTGPTGTVLDSVIKTVVDLEGSMLGHVLDPLLNPQGQYSPEWIFVAPAIGVDFIPPWVLLIAPEPGDVGSVDSCKIVSHTPKGWQHIIGGRSPKWVRPPTAKSVGGQDLSLTKRPLQRIFLLDSRQCDDSHWHHRDSKRPAIRVPQQLVPRVPAHRTLRTQNPSGTVSSGHRGHACDKQCPLQRGNPIRLYQCALG